MICSSRDITFSQTYSERIILISLFKHQRIHLGHLSIQVGMRFQIHNREVCQHQEKLPKRKEYSQSRIVHSLCKDHSKLSCTRLRILFYFMLNVCAHPAHWQHPELGILVTYLSEPGSIKLWDAISNQASVKPRSPKLLIRSSLSFLQLLSALHTPALGFQQGLFRGFSPTMHTKFMAGGSGRADFIRLLSVSKS